MTYYVYKHVENDKVVYVGFGEGKRQFVRTYLRSEKHADWILAMLKKVGKDYSKIVKYFNEKSDALFFERLMIKKYQPKFNKYHIKDFKHTLETRKKFGQSGDKNPMYGKKHSSKTIAKIRSSCNNVGENNGMFGKKHSDETRAKLREAWIRRKANVN